MDPIIVGLTSSVLGIACGIVAVIAGSINEAKRNKNSTLIRQAIIENHVDAETAKQLLKQDARRPKSKYNVLFWALALIGLGVGYIFNAVTHLTSEDSFGAWLIMALFMGIGLFVAFIIKENMESKHPTKTDEE